MTTLRNMVVIETQQEAERENEEAEEAAEEELAEGELPMMDDSPQVIPVVHVEDDGESDDGKVVLDGGHVNASYQAAGEPTFKPRRFFATLPATGIPSRTSTAEGYGSGVGLKECREQYMAMAKLSKLCLSTFDASGKCVDAQGSLRRILQPVK